MRGKLGLVLMGGAMLSKSLIQFSVDGRGCVPSPFFDLRPKYGGGNDEKKAKVKSLSRALFFVTPWIVACTKLLCPWDFQGKSTGVGCHFLLQGTFPTQGSNPGLSHCRQTLYSLSHHQVLNPGLQHFEHGVLATGPPGKSL